MEMPPIDDSILNDQEVRSDSPQYMGGRELPPQQYMYYQPEVNQVTKKDIFSDLDKTAYIIIFVAFILGFFMGKTMQPVILRQ